MSVLKKMCGELTDEDYARNVMLDDLQLAAELGKTLLERNKELETSLRQHQICVEDQAQEIYHLSKQTVTLREVNETRVRFYEQLEVSIHDLERANHKLVLDNLAQKKHIKSLNATIESLEGKCEELQATVDEQKLRLNELERISQQHVATPTTTETTKSVVKDFVTPKPLERRDDSKGTDSLDSSRRTDEEKCTPPKNAPPAPQSVATTEQPKSINNGAQNKESFYDTDCDMEQVNQLVAELRIARAQCNRDERRITELEEQLSSLVQQNQELENQLVQLAHREEDSNMKSMHEELTTLEEVRQGQMCCRCLRSLDYSNSEIIDDDSMLDEILEISGPEQVHRSSFNMEIQAHPADHSSPIHSPNPYQDMVQRYEELVEMQRRPIKPNHALSLQEEMEMSGDYKAFGAKDASRKTFSSPTDFSEAETSSSGFNDETSNKFTQTDGLIGSLLCTIADGDNYQFSIYDDTTPIDSRFKDMPQYREVFKDIFNVLKDAADRKQRGVDLPLLDDYPSADLDPDMPSMTSSLDQTLDFPDDDSQSIVSTMSDLSVSQHGPTTVVENAVQPQSQPKPAAEPQASVVQERVLRPLVRPALEFLSVEVRKRPSSRRKNKFAERSDSPVTHIIGSPKINYSSRPISGRSRREQSKKVSAETDSSNSASNSNVSNTSVVSNSNLASNSISAANSISASTDHLDYEFKPSSASQDLHKLKTLDLSYAQVLRKADHTKIRGIKSGTANVMICSESATGNMMRSKHSGSVNSRSSKSSTGGNRSRFSKNRPM